MANSNGNGKQLNFILGTFGVAIVSGFIWVGSVTAKLEQTEAELKDLWGMYNDKMKEQAVKEKEYEHRVTQLEGYHK